MGDPIAQKLIADWLPAWKRALAPSRDLPHAAPVPADQMLLASNNRSAVALIQQMNQDVLLKAPHRLALKYQNMAISPRRFMTGQPELRAFDLRGLLAQGGPRVPVQGDMHLNNFGAVQLASGKIKVRLNDFDMAYVGPAAFDLNSMATHITLAARENGLSTAQGRQLVKAFGESYYETLGRIAARDPHPGVKPPKALKQMLADAKGVDAQKWLDREVPLKHGRRSFAVKGKYEAVSPQAKRDVENALAGYRAGLSPEANQALAGYHVTDVVSVFSGTGSMGYARYKVLLEGPARQDPIILELKEQVPASAAAYAPPVHFASEGERNVAIAHLMDGGLDPFRGVAHLPASDAVSNASFLVERANPAEDFLNCGKLNKPGPFADLVRYYGSQAALSHARGAAVGLADAAEIRRGLGDPAAFTSGLADFGHRYANQVEKDFRDFKQALKQSPLLANPASPSAPASTVSGRQR